MPTLARVSLVTLGVADVAASTAFIKHLAGRFLRRRFRVRVSFFNTAGGLLAVWSREALAKDAGFEPTARAESPSVTLAMNLESPAQVNEACLEIREAGGKIVRPPATASWGGYTAYAANPEGHLWEIAYNSDGPIGEDGRPVLPNA